MCTRVLDERFYETPISMVGPVRFTRETRHVVPVFWKFSFRQITAKSSVFLPTFPEFLEKRTPTELFDYSRSHCVIVKSRFFPLTSADCRWDRTPCIGLRVFSRSTVLEPNRLAPPSARVVCRATARGNYSSPNVLRDPKWCCSSAKSRMYNTWSFLTTTTTPPPLRRTP